MRRPLFGNGIPQTVGALTSVFDAAEFSNQAVFAVTLYIWWVQNGAAGPFSASNIALLNYIAGAPSGPISGAFGVYLDELWDTPALTKPPAPLKVLDRFMVRGNQEIRIGSDDLESPVWMWGYFESVGEQESPRPFRGLQPGTLVTPFNYTPTLLTAGEDEDLTAVVHKLSPTYIDMVTLDVETQCSTADEANVRHFVTFPGGVQVPMATFGEPSVRMLDGIPMIAPSSVDVNIGTRIVTQPGATGIINAYGSFDRG